MQTDRTRRSALRRPGSAVRAWLRLVRVYQKVQKASSAEFRAAGLSLAHFDVLAQIGAADGSSQQQIADALLVTKSNVTQLLDRMERAGLVERRQQGRTNALYLTMEGRRLHDQIVPAHEQHIADLLASLTPEEVATLSATLRKLDHALR